MTDLGILSWQSQEPVLILLTALVQGLFIGWVGYKGFKTDKTMTMTCMLLPAVVACALWVINGSLGTGIAILGVFGLVRFRSLPGQGTDILSVFFAMAAGLMASTGYLAAALSLTALIGLCFLVVAALGSRILKSPGMVRISVPEDLMDLSQLESVLKPFGSIRLISMKTSHMGTLYDLSYEISLADDIQPGALMDALRQFNGNLPVVFYQDMPSVNA